MNLQDMLDGEEHDIGSQIAVIGRQNLDSLQGLPDGLILLGTHQDSRRYAAAMGLSHVLHVIGSAAGTYGGAGVAGALGLPPLAVAPLIGMIAAVGVQTLCQYAFYSTQPNNTGNTQQNVSGFANLLSRTILLAPLTGALAIACNAALLYAGLPPLASGSLAPTLSLAVSIPVTLHAYDDVRTEQNMPFDALLVLGGSAERSVHAAKAYHAMVTKGRSLPVFTTGYTSGLSKARTDTPEAVSSRQILQANNVPSSSIYLEPDSRDWWAAAVYLEPLLRILPEKSNIGVVIERDYWPRARFTLERVIGNRYSFSSVICPGEVPVKGDLVEYAVRLAWAIDFARLGIMPGDVAGWNNYLKTAHPFHGSRPVKGAYWLGIQALSHFIK